MPRRSHNERRACSERTPPHPHSLAEVRHGWCAQADVAVLDEIDSGLDIDALRDVADAVNGLKRPNSATLMVTHYKVAPALGWCGRCSRVVCACTRLCRH